jgi:hypothetical protein
VLETVASFQDPTEAQIVCALFESAGIDASVADLHLVVANWPWAQALGGVRVQVPREDFDEARRLLAAYRAGELDPEDEAPPSETCGACGSEEIDTVVPGQQKVLALAVFALSGAPISTRTQRVCKRCGAVETPD